MCDCSSRLGLRLSAVLENVSLTHAGRGTLRLLPHDIFQRAVFQKTLLSSRQCNETTPFYAAEIASWLESATLRFSSQFVLAHK